MLKSFKINLIYQDMRKLNGPRAALGGIALSLTSACASTTPSTQVPYEASFVQVDDDSQSSGGSGGADYSVSGDINET